LRWGLKQQPLRPLRLLVLLRVGLLPVMRLWSRALVHPVSACRLAASVVLPEVSLIWRPV